MAKVKAEYIWIDGSTPTPKLRSKTKIIDGPVSDISQIPEWGFDGSSTQQAVGDDSDRAMHPVAFVPDPIRGGDHILVLTGVYYPDGETHETNKRVRLAQVAEAHALHEAWFGIEQEYTMLRADGTPLGFPEGGGFPGPQGPYYCGVGYKNVGQARQIVEEHLDLCLEAGINVEGINAEVAAGQWEYQVFAKGAARAGDETWVARYLLSRTGEKYGLRAHPLPGLLEFRLEQFLFLAGQFFLNCPCGSSFI